MSPAALIRHALGLRRQRRFAAAHPGRTRIAFTQPDNKTAPRSLRLPRP